jgi:hypothetical protein
MDIKQALRVFIEQGSPEVGRGYPVKVPQDAQLPSFAYRVLNDSATIAHSGRIVMKKATMQISAHGRDYPQAARVESLIRAKLDGYKGQMAGVTVEYCKTSVSDEWADAQALPISQFNVTIVYLP